MNNNEELDALEQKIGELESRIRAYDAVLKIKNEVIADYVIKINNQEQAFLDQAAIAAMQTIMTDTDYNLHYCEVVAKGAYQQANALLAEKKRLQGGG